MIKSNDCFFIIYTFLLLYCPPVILINTHHFLSIIAWCIILNNKELRNVLLTAIVDSISLFLIFFYLLLVGYFYSNPGTCLTPFIFLFEILPCSIFLVYTNKIFGNYSILTLIIISSTVQSVIAILSYFISPLHNLIINHYISYGYNDIYNLMSGWRLYGFSYIMPYSMPVIQSFIACFVLYKGLNYNSKYFFLVPLIFISGVINARIAIVIFILSLFILFLTFDNICIYLSKLLCFSFFIILVYFILYPFFSDTNNTTISWIIEGLEDIYNLFFSNTYDSNSYMSYAQDSTNYMLPNNVYEIIFGTGSLARENAVYNSDVGFINDIWLGGIIYCLSIILYFIKHSFSIICFYFNKSNSYILFFGITIILLCVNIKGRCFSWNEIINLWFILYSMYIIDNYNLNHK